MAKAKKSKPSSGKKLGKPPAKSKKASSPRAVKSKQGKSSIVKRPVAKPTAKFIAKPKSKPSVKSGIKSAAKIVAKHASKTTPRPLDKKASANPLPKAVASKVSPAKIAAPVPLAKSVKLQALMPSKPGAKSPTKSVPSLGMAVEKKPDKTIEKAMKKSKEAERKGISIPAPVPTDTKPSKNQMGLKSAELEHFRDMLLAKRRELVGDMSSMEREALQRGGSNLSNLPLHMADMGTDNYEQEFTLGLMEKDRNLLREINNALAKIQNGTYGICEGTQLPISKARLEAQPWARFSIEHARKLEKRMGR